MTFTVMWKRPFSISTFLTIAFCSFSTILLVAFGLFADRIASRELVSAERRELDQIALRLSSRLDVDMLARLRAVATAADSAVLTSEQASADDKRRLLQRMRAQLWNFAWLGLTDPKGVVVASASGLLEGMSVAARPWFKAGQSGPVTLDLHPALLLEKYVPQTNGEPVRFVDVAAPVIRNGEFLGVLAGHLSWSWAREVKQSILDNSPVLNGVELLVTDAQGVVTLGPRELIGSRIDIPGIEASRLQDGPDGVGGYVTSIARSNGLEEYHGLGWIAVARKPVEIALAPIHRLRRVGLLGVAILGASFLIIGIRLARSVAHPLQDLATAAKEVGSNADAVIPVVRSYREVMTLSEALRGSVAVLTQQKRALSELNESLESEVSRRTADLVKAKNTAEDATRAKADFLATMSHEVRTPLGSIIGFADLLLEDGALSSVQRRRLEMIQEAGGFLSTVINDILDFSKIEAGHIELIEEAFELRPLVQGCATILAQQADAKGIGLSARVDADVPAWVAGDEMRLRQILINLLSNAVKFTRQGAVTLSVRLQAGALAFSVTDTGIGIAPEKLSRLFNRFSQLDSSIQREFGGTGLGLAISQRLVSLMGSVITVESQEGRGSIFAFNLSLQAAETRPAHDARIGSVHAGARRILLVEDLLTNQEIITSMLTQRGHDVVVRSDGLAGIEAASAVRFDIILMDIQMPGLDGVTATRMIREGGPNAQTPILALTANVMAEQVRAYRAAGMTGHIGKPISRRELIAAVESFASTDQPGRTGAAPEPARTTAPDAEVVEELVSLLGTEKVAGYFDDFRTRLLALCEYRPDAREAMRQAAHKLVGIAGMLGYFEVADLCRTLENACDDGHDLEAPLRAVTEQVPATLRDVTLYFEHSVAA